eukprot:SAG31_NODE_741_length_12429_cov_13.571127_5_plen_122_part_00
MSCGLHGSCHGGRCICNNWFEGVDCTAPSVPAADDYFHSLTSAGARASGGAVSGQANTAEECIETGTTSFVSSDLEFVSDTSGALSCSEQLVCSTVNVMIANTKVQCCCCTVRLGFASKVC